MGLLRHRPSGVSRLAGPALGVATALAMGLAILCVAETAGAAQILACKLSIDDGQRQSPPSDMTISVAPDEWLKWTDTGWTRNQCGNHGGVAPDVACSIHDGHFQADFDWESNIGRLERHVVLNLTSGELIVRNHNGLEQKGVCRPAPAPVLPAPVSAPALAPAASPKPVPHS
jgi:hypothetical protein